MSSDYIWEVQLGEEEALAYLVYSKPLAYVLKKTICEYVGPEKKDAMRISKRGFYGSRKVFLGYFSERELIVVLFNRFDYSSNNWKEVFDLIRYFDQKRIPTAVQLFLGMMYLNEYVSNVKNRSLLDEARTHLRMAKLSLCQNESLRAVDAILAFCEHMDQAAWDLELKYA